MMKGVNELRLNESTMMEAVEYWLTNQVFNANMHASTVTAVEQTQGIPREFKITLYEVEERKE